MTGKEKSSPNKRTADAKPVVNKGGRPKGTTAENHLTTPTAVRCAMVQCYREAKSKKLDSLVASRLVTILTQPHRMIIYSCSGSACLDSNTHRPAKSGPPVSQLVSLPVPH